MDHGAAGLALEHLAGDQGGDQVGADRFAAFVDEGGAVAVAVEADAQVRLLLDDQRAQVAQVSGSRDSPSWFGKLPSSSK